MQTISIKELFQQIIWEKNQEKEKFQHPPTPPDRHIKFALNSSYHPQLASQWNFEIQTGCISMKMSSRSSRTNLMWTFSTRNSDISPFVLKTCVMNMIISLKPQSNGNISKPNWAGENLFIQQEYFRIKFKIFQNLLKLNWAGNIEVWKEVATIGRQILKQRPVGNTDTQRHLNTG